MGRQSVRQILQSLGLACGLCWVAAAEADVVSDLALSHTAELSDNVTRLSDDVETVQDLASTLELEYRLFANEPQFRADLATDLAFTSYVDETFDPNLSGNLRFISVIDLVSDQFTWIVGDLYQERARLGRSSVDPDERVRTNYLFMGPRLVFKPTRVDEVDLRILAFEESVHEPGEANRETQRFNTRLGWSHRLSRRQTLSLWGDYRVIRPEDEPQLSLLNGFVRYNVERALGEIEIDAGVTQAMPDGEDTSTNTLFRLSLERDLSRFTRLGLSAGRAYSDLGDLEIRDQVLQVSDGVRAADGVFLEDSVGMVLERKIRRTTQSLGLRYRQLDYTSDAVRDLSDWRAVFDWEWSVNPRHRLGFNLSARRSDYQENSAQGAELDERNALGIRYAYRHSREVDSSFELRWLNNRNDLDDDENYDVRSLLWTLRWQPLSRYDRRDSRQQRRDLQSLIQ